jgi:6-phosphofructo-2-kinase
VTNENPLDRYHSHRFHLQSFSIFLDYRDMDPEQAIADFKQRREMYMRVYEPVDSLDGPHIKIINSREFIGSSCYVFVIAHVVLFRSLSLMLIHCLTC